MAILDEIKELEKNWERVSIEKPLIEPATKEEKAIFSFKVNRDPYMEFPDRLPTFGKMPLPPDEHKHIGLYENKQTIYLLLAHAYNKVMERLDKLEEKNV